ncbi:hypothetical protein [Kocuria sp.]|uniref:hypothetical protein n=1 Tax=Kocuria sp. TaxID=1871328 RepID=UPI0026DD68CD|nr:hypothetical protein [Kocuria sp.]MDO4919688.1 hypothetical protein [Kocuria sp.]
MTRSAMGQPPNDALISVLITYRDHNGRQGDLPPSSFRESFTALQEITQSVLDTAGDGLSGYSQDFAAMQKGPSSFEIEVHAHLARGSAMLGRLRGRRSVSLVSLLDHLTNVLIALGDAICCLASHPDARVRYVEGYYGPYYEILDGGLAGMAVEARSMEVIVTPRFQEAFRPMMANFVQPWVAYVTFTQRVLGLEFMRRTQVLVNEHTRAFAHGAPLRVTEETLREAREAPDAVRSDQWVDEPLEEGAGW